ncbi:MAG: hypothetical protein KME21_27690 [Desmonostoc vinosum HA7617-LM4]|jgi:hypothetical protein|nr:hypothetical protein [Desmonostoc vinosum HA7617-LM4]
MSRNHKFKFLCHAAMSALAVILAIAPVNALPGQNINTVIKWAKTRTKLPVLRYNNEAYGYSGTKGNLYFYVNVTLPNETVIKEGITVSRDPNVKFTRKNTKAIKLVQDIYSYNLANDFNKSRYITKIDRDLFYRGKKFAYIAAEVQDGSAFQIIELSKLHQEIGNAKYCQTHVCDI